MIEHKPIGNVVHQRHQEDAYNEAEKERVVFSTDAVVYPATVMVELVHAAIAGAAVLRGLVNVGLTNVTLKLVIGAVEYFPIG